MVREEARATLQDRGPPSAGRRVAPEHRRTRLPVRRRFCAGRAGGGSHAGFGSGIKTNSFGRTIRRMERMQRISPADSRGFVRGTDVVISDVVVFCLIRSDPFYPSNPFLKPLKLTLIL